MRSAAVGGILWCVLSVPGLAGTAPLGIIERLFLLAPLALVPLALDLVADRGRLGAARALVPWCASAAAASFLVRRGVPAAVLAGLWLAFTGLLAWDGLDRLRGGAWREAGQAALAAGLVFVPIGGGWLVLSRLGVAPLGFEEPIVLLTAVHFHYAACITPVLTGLMVRSLGATPRRWALVCGVVAGPPLLAAGITLSPLVEAVGVVVVAVAVGGVALDTLAHLRSLTSRPLARGLLAVSSLSVLVPLALAVGYAGGRFVDHPVISLATMARIHGTANALGFSLCGLLGWTLVLRRNLGPTVL